MSPIRVGYPLPSTVQWSDGANFNGYALIGIKELLDTSLVAWPSIARGNSSLRRTMPQFIQLPIQEGVFLANPCGVPYNADLTPPQSQYVAFYYDSNGKRVGGVTSAFTVSSGTFTVPSVTLTAPTVGSNPTPN
jgi:hypothetical protein